MNNNEHKIKHQSPPQHQPQHPGIESLMVPEPIIEDTDYKGSGKLKDKVCYYYSRG